MRVTKYIGIILIVLAFIAALGIVGRVETEDRQYRSGEITQEEMTGTEELVKQMLFCGGVAVVGGIIWATGAYMEADKIERRLYK